MQTSPTSHTPRELADRPQFNTVLSAVLIAAALVSGCGGSAAGPTSPRTPNPTNAAGNVVGTVAANHERPHVALITAAQLAAAAPIVMDISNGLHGHTVTLTGTEVGQIAAGTRVSVTSSTDPHSNGMGPHSHMVTFN